MKMAKPSQKDIESAGVLAQILNALDEDNRWGCGAIGRTQDFFEICDDFNPLNQDHLESLYEKLMRLMHEHPSFHNRVIGGMCHVIMWDKNQIVDPDSDVIDLHPRFEETWNDLQRETQAARYWNMRYHQMVEENNQLRSIVSACADAVGAHCDKSASLEFMDSVATEVYLFVDKLRQKYQREHIDTNRWKNRAELAEAIIEQANKQESVGHIELLDRLLDGDSINKGATIAERLNALQQYWYLTAIEDAKSELSHKVQATDEKCNELGEPEVIYLQLHDPESFDVNEQADYRADGVTWCWHPINKTDVRYIRADLAGQAKADHNQLITVATRLLENPYFLDMPKSSLEMSIAPIILALIDAARLTGFVTIEDQNLICEAVGDYYRNEIASKATAETETRRISLDAAVDIFEQTACHQTYKMQEGVKAVVEYALSTALQEGEPFEWVVSSLSDKDLEKESNAVRLLIDLRKVANDDARYQAERREMRPIPEAMTVLDQYDPYAHDWNDYRKVMLAQAPKPEAQKRIVFGAPSEDFIPPELLLKPDLTEADIEEWRKSQANQNPVAQS